MKKITLLQTFSIFILNICVAQDTKIVSLTPEKKYAISLGTTHSSMANGYGGNLKLDYLTSPKLSLGIKTIATTCAPYDYNGSTFNVTSINRGINFLSDFTLTYYFIGDYYNSKTGVYADLGLGYHIAKSDFKYQYAGEPSTRVNGTQNGLGAHLSLGSSCKLGAGNIYLEAIGRNLINGIVRTETSIEGSLGQPTVYSRKSGLNIDYLFNLGYRFCF
jgi:hypothetical protein